MRILDTGAIAAMKMAQTPYRWGALSRTFASADIAVSLQKTYPESGMTLVESGSDEKRYSLRGRCLTREGGNADLDALWRALVKELLSDDYREALEACSGLDLRALEVEVTAWRQTAGGFISPHTDKEGKTLTHLIYFSRPDWPAAWGGCLRILSDCDINAVVAELPPCLASSVVLVRDEKSWHGYTPVKPEADPRLALQVIFHASDPDYSRVL